MIRNLLITTAITCTLASAESVKFTPFLHTNIAFGTASIDESNFGRHEHDPNDEFTLQGIEFGTKITYGDYLEAYGGALFLVADGIGDFEFEEHYFKVKNIPYGFELRAGRFLNRTTNENTRHIHGWDFVNAPLNVSRFLGEDGLVTNSFELSWFSKTENPFGISIAYGQTVPHEEEEEEEGEEEGTVPGEEVFFDESVLTIGISGEYNYNDFHKFTYSGHYGTGNNFTLSTTRTYSASVGYQWRQNGLNAGGKSFKTAFEWSARDADFVTEDGVSGDSFENAFSLSGIYQFNDAWILGSRYEYLEGTDDLGETPEVRRFDLALTRRAKFNDTISGHTRIQYTNEDTEEFGNEHAVWLQFQVSFGGH